MKYRLRLVFVGLIINLLAGACDSSSNLDDPNDSYFVKFYGGDGDQTGADVVALPDGTFILFGTTKLTGAEKTSQWYLVKADAKGNIVWEKKYGGVNDDEARDIELTSANTLVAVGNTYTTPTDRDIMLMTFALDGTKIDSTTVSLGVNSDEDAASVSVISNGFIVAGSTNNTSLKAGSLANDLRDAVHLRFTTNLVQYPSSWARAYGPGTYDAAIKVIEVSPTQFYVFGYSNKNVAGQTVINSNFWVYGIGQFGSPNSNEYTIGDPNADEVLNSVSVKVTSGVADYFLSGMTYGLTATKQSDIYISKLREALFPPSPQPLPPPLFQKPLSLKPGNDLPQNASIFTTKDGGFLLLTNEKSFNDNQNWMLIKLDTFGSTVWSLPIIFGGEGLDTCGSVQELPDGRILLVGTMRTGKPDAGEFKMALIKVNQDGKFAN